MGAKENEKAIQRFFEGLMRQDMSVLDEVFAENAVEEYPQSGERIVGLANIKAVVENYPGLPKVEIGRILADGDLVTAASVLDYDGKIYHGISVFEFKDGKVARQTDYFAEPFPAPEWRAEWVEKI